MKHSVLLGLAVPTVFALAAAGVILFAPAQVRARLPSNEHDGAVLVLQVDAQAAQTQAAEFGSLATSDAIARSIPILRARLEALGVRDGDVRQEGKDRIVVDAPGQANSPRLRAVMTDRARLTFQLVDDSYDPQAPNAGPPPSDDVILPDVSGRRCGGACSLAVRRQVWVTGGMIAHAQQGFNLQSDLPVVQFRLDPAGALSFAGATRENVGHRFAIVFDGKVIETPVIETPILGGKGEIDGNFTVESAADLALLLRSGELPAPLMVVDTRPTSSHGG